MVQESVEGFRKHLAKLQNMKGLTCKEKGSKLHICIAVTYVFAFGSDVHNGLNNAAAIVETLLKTCMLNFM